MPTTVDLQVFGSQAKPTRSPGVSRSQSLRLEAEWLPSRIRPPASRNGFLRALFNSRGQLPGGRSALPRIVSRIKLNHELPRVAFGQTHPRGNSPDMCVHGRLTSVVFHAPREFSLTQLELTRCITLRHAGGRGLGFGGRSRLGTKPQAPNPGSILIAFIQSRATDHEFVEIAYIISAPSTGDSEPALVSSSLDVSLSGACDRPRPESPFLARAVRTAAPSP
jgi:hypothetical protein